MQINSDSITYRKNGADYAYFLGFYNYTRSRITGTRLYRIISYFEGHLPHQKSVH